MNFEQDLQIDRSKLDEEQNKQPVLYGKYAKKYAIATINTYRKKAELDVIEAELWKEIVQNPTPYTGGKTTVDLIKQAIVRHPSRIKCVVELNDLKEEEAVYKAAMYSMAEKGKSLSDLVKMYLNNYYADPAISDEAKRILNSDAQKKVSDKLKKNKRLKKRLK